MPVKRNWTEQRQTTIPMMRNWCLAAVLLFPMAAALAQQPETKAPPASVDEPPQGDLQIMSDTHGVDMAAYLRNAVGTIRENWYGLIPRSAHPPQSKSGTVWIQFKIEGDGRLAAMKLLQPSGDTSLDRAAWEAIARSNRFEKLPKPLKKDGITLRLRFVYNPPKTAQIRPSNNP